jgi:hypothetical protein
MDNDRSFGLAVAWMLCILCGEKMEAKEIMGWDKQRRPRMQFFHPGLPLFLLILRNSAY